MEVKGTHKSNRPAGDVIWRATYSVNGQTVVWDCKAVIVDDRWTSGGSGQISIRPGETPENIAEAVRQAAADSVRLRVEGRVE